LVDDEAEEEQEDEEEVEGERAKDWCSGGSVVVAMWRRGFCCVWFSVNGIGGMKWRRIVDAESLHRRDMVKGTEEGGTTREARPPPILV